MRRPPVTITAEARRGRTAAIVDGGAGALHEMAPAYGSVRIRCRFDLNLGARLF